MIFAAPFGRYIAPDPDRLGHLVLRAGGVGWAVGASWERFHHASRFTDIAVAVAIDAAAAIWLVRRFKNRRRACRRGPEMRLGSSQLLSRACPGRRRRHGFHRIEGERWPGPMISIWNTTAYTVPVLDAERAPGRQPGPGCPVRAGRPTGATADVVVRYGPPQHAGPGERRLRAWWQHRDAASRGLGRWRRTTLPRHELGHVLGLGHETRGCTVMAPVVDAGAASRCGLGACKVLWRCLVQRDDRNGAIALYGRRIAR